MKNILKAVGITNALITVGAVTRANNRRSINSSYKPFTGSNLKLNKTRITTQL